MFIQSSSFNRRRRRRQLTFAISCFVLLLTACFCSSSKYRSSESIKKHKQTSQPTHPHMLPAAFRLPVPTTKFDAEFCMKFTF